METDVEIFDLSTFDMKRGKSCKKLAWGFGVKQKGGEARDMLKKQCPECGRNTFSADTFSPWACVHCGADLTKEPAQIPDQPWEPTAEDRQVVDREIAEFEEDIGKEEEGWVSLSLATPG